MVEEVAKGEAGKRNNVLLHHRQFFYRDVYVKVVVDDLMKKEILRKGYGERRVHTFVELSNHW